MPSKIRNLSVVKLKSSISNLFRHCSRTTTINYKRIDLQTKTGRHHSTNTIKHAQKWTARLANDHEIVKCCE